MAVQWYEKAGERGSPECHYRLGRLYSDGRSVSKDGRRAVELLRKAAEKSLPAAQYHLGLMYANGAFIPKNDIKACAWISVAAALSYEPAMTWLSDTEAVMPETKRVEAQNLADRLFALL